MIIIIMTIKIIIIIKLHIIKDNDDYNDDEGNAQSKDQKYQKRKNVNNYNNSK